jgi:site-specific recombinase XerD
MTNQLALTRHNIHLSGSTNAALAGSDVLSEAAETFISASISENTRKAYRSDLAHYTAWGGTLPATPEQVARYLADHADTLAPSSLARRIATLSKVHAANEWPNPCQSEVVRATIRGIKRVKGTAQDQAKPLLREDMFLVLDAMGNTPRDQRDRALLLIGWAGGFRCSELVGLDHTYIDEVREGLILTLRRSKPTKPVKVAKSASPLVEPVIAPSRP